MSRPASFMLTAQRVLHSRSDLHEDIITDHGLHPDGVRGPNMVRVELTPDRRHADLNTPWEGWKYLVNQDVLPEWYEPVRDEARVRAAMPEWAKTHLFIDRTGTVKDTMIYVFGKSQVTACGGCIVYAYGDSFILASDSAKVNAFEHCRVTAGGNSFVLADDDAGVVAGANARVEAAGLARVWLDGSAYASLTGAATVIRATGRATVRHAMPQPVKPGGPYTVFIDDVGVRSVCEVGSS